MQIIIDGQVIELPAWTEERHLYVLSGMELVVYRFQGEERAHVKTGRCNMCGKCCERLQCIKQAEDRSCGEKLGRPFSCCVGVSSHINGCTERFD